MPSVIIDPDEVRHFANYLAHTAEAIMERERDTTAAYRHLTELWKDEKYRQFDEVFHDLLIYLNNFCQGAQMMAAHLDRKARAVDDYLQGGYR